MTQITFYRTRILYSLLKLEYGKDIEILLFPRYCKLKNNQFRRILFGTKQVECFQTRTIRLMGQMLTLLKHLAARLKVFVTTVLYFSDFVSVHFPAYILLKQHVL